MKRMTKVLGVITLAMVMLALGVEPALAEGPSTPSYSGDLWHRSTLTGDWFGARNDLAAKGITFEMNLTQVYQGVVDGGKDDSWKYGGRGEFIFHLDTQKLGLWPGGFFTVQVEGNFNDSVNGLTGALNPANTNQIFPMPTGDNLNVPNVSFMQFLSPYAAVMLGKLALLTPNSGDMNEFAHGKGDTLFMNGAFNINPVTLLTVPYSTLGAGVILLPTKNPHDAIVGFSVLQTGGKAETSGFDDLRSDELSFVGEARIRTNFFGLTGHQLIGGGYSNKTYASLDQSLRFFIENRDIEKQDGSWMVYYNFDQYLYEPKKGSGQGIGIFGRLGASDGDPNPMRFFFSFGFGGKGIIPGRPLDRFGIGYYYMDVRSAKFTGLHASREFLRDESGFEAFYNIAIAPWLQLTPDIQVIRPAQKEMINGEDVRTATVLGLRLKTIF
jgi:porin